MGYISLSVLASFALLVAYSVLVSGAHAETSSDGLNNVEETQHKRPAPAVWLKSYPIRRLRPMNAFSVYRREMQPSDVEFFDDTSDKKFVDKRFDDYGHMR